MPEGLLLAARHDFASMDGLIYTPRRADFLKDGSIFAQSPAGTSNAACPPRFPVADASNRFVPVQLQ